MDTTAYPSPMAHGLTMTNTSLVPSQFFFFVAWEQGYVVHHI